MLDEATSALDKYTEEKIIESIFKNCKEKMIVIISHKLRTLKYCDTIYKIKGGKISETTNPFDLLNK